MAARLVSIDTAKPSGTQLPAAVRDELDAGYVRFVDQDGDPLPAGSVTTIVVDTATGDIADITYEGPTP